MSDDCAIELLDDTRKHRNGRSGRIVIGINGFGTAGALFPGGGRSSSSSSSSSGRVDGFLHVCAVEVDCCSSCRDIWIATIRKAENAPEQGTGFGDLPNVEARVYLADGCYNVGPEIAAGYDSVVGGVRQETVFGREDEVFIEIGCVAAGVGPFVQLLSEGCVEGK